MNDEGKKQRIRELALLLLLASTLLIYAPVGSYDFIKYDDHGYVAGNAHVKAGLTHEGIMWAFRDASVGHWHPLTWISHMADVNIYGLNPGGHHLTNLIFHLLNICLLFFVLRQMTGLFWQSLFVAALFAVHPLNVESVAWVAERKNVLSTFFWLAAMGAYAYYVKRPGLWRYTAIVLLFALGLLAKPMLVTLPFVFLLLDYWPLKRWPGQVPGSDGANSFFAWGKRSGAFFLLWEKLPLFLLSGISIIFTFWSARVGGALVNTVNSPFGPRLSNALVSCGAYLVKMIWPFNFSVFYPFPEAIPLGKVLASAFFLAGMTIFVIFQAKRLPYLVTGWLWYMGTLVPVIGLVQVGAQAMADRYAYVTLIGIFVILTWGSFDLLGNVRKGIAILAISALLIITALAARTWLQVQLWQNTTTLFQHALAVTEGNYLAHDTLGVALLDEGKRGEAITHFLRAVEIKPTFEVAYNHAGVALQSEGKFSEALSYYRKAIEAKPDYSDAFYNMGTLFFSMGRLDDAITAYRQAIKWKPKSAPAYNNLGAVLIKKEELDAAIVAFRQALLLEPNYAGAHGNLALALKIRGFSAEAEVHFREAARINSLNGGR